MEQNAVLQGLAQAIAPYLPSNGALLKATGTPNADYIYQGGGLFGTCAHNPALINAMVGPYGYMSKLRWVGLMDLSPIVKSITYIGSTGDEQSTGCGDCGKPIIRRCAQTTCFGRVCQMTDEMQYDEIGLRQNENVPTMAFYGNITDPMGNVLIRQGQQIENTLTLQIGAVAYNLRRLLAVDIWSGNPAANVGARWHPTGFDLLINTGKEDALTGIDCNALDSIVVNHGNQVVGAAGTTSILSQIRGIVRAIRARIEGAGFDQESAVIDIVMSPQIWDCVAESVACAYGLQCADWAGANNPMVGLADSATKRLEMMRNQMVLPVDGKNYPVTLDNGITVVNRPVGNDTARCSTIYVITRILPGAPNGGTITWGEYQDFDRTGARADAVFKQLSGNTWVKSTDGGKYAIAGTVAGGFCADLRVLAKTRVRMLMPQLAGRITNVCCVNTIGPDQYPDVTGSGGIYEVGGGATTTPEMYLYGDCWPTHVGSNW